MRSSQLRSSCTLLVVVEPAGPVAGVIGEVLWLRCAVEEVAGGVLYDTHRLAAGHDRHCSADGGKRSEGCSGAGAKARVAPCHSRLRSAPSIRLRRREWHDDGSGSAATLAAFATASGREALGGHASVLAGNGVRWSPPNSTSPRHTHNTALGGPAEGFNSPIKPVNYRGLGSV